MIFYFNRSLFLNFSSRKRSPVFIKEKDAVEVKQHTFNGLQHTFFKMRANLGGK